MKKLILFLTALQLACTASAATYYKVTLTVTSVPPVKAALSGDGDLRQVTNSTPANAGKFWQSTNTLQATATNLVEHLRSYAFTNQLAVKLGTNDTATPTNTVVIELSPDRFVSFTSLSNWVSITYSTNTTASGWLAVRVPLTNEAITVQTQVLSGLVAALNMNVATNIVSNAAPVMANFLSTKTNAQAVTNLSLSGGTQMGVRVTNAIADRLSIYAPFPYTIGQYTNWGLAFIHTNGTIGAILTVSATGIPMFVTPDGQALTNVSSSTPVTYAAAHHYLGVRINDDPADFETNVWQTVNIFTNRANRWESGSVSNANLLSGGIYGDWTVGNTEFYFTNSYFLWGADSIIYDMASARTFTFADDPDTGGRYTNSVLSFADFNRTQFSLGVGDFESLMLASGLATTNQALYGFKTNSGAIIHQSGTVTTLAAGNNVMTRLTNGFTYLSTASGAATLVGITNGFGADDAFEAFNNTGYPLTVAHESGVAPIAATRITIGDGTTTSVVVSNGGWMTFRYDGTTSRWRLLHPAPPPVINATATNTVVYTNDVSAGSGVLNFIGVTVTNYNGTNFVVITATGSTNFVPLTNGTAFNLAATALANTDVALTVTNATGRTNDVLRALGTNGTSGLRVGANGNVGIGTNVPTAALEVQGSVSVSGSILNGASYGLEADSDGNFRDITIGNARVIYLRSGGDDARITSPNTGLMQLGGIGLKVGINMAAPTAVLTITNLTATTPSLAIFTSNNPTAALSVKSNSVVGVGHAIEFSQTTVTNSTATDSARLFAANVSGTAELIAEDEAGNVVQLTSHPADAPAAFYIVTNWTKALPRISKTVNRYIGVIEWNNDTLGVLLRRWELRGTNIAGLPQGVRNAIANALHEEETFAEYNARMGYTNGHPEALVRANWVSLQAQRQAGYDAARLKEIEEFNTPLTVTNAQGAVVTLPNNTNVTVRADRDIRKPQPDRLRERVEQSRGKGKRN